MSNCWKSHAAAQIFLYVLVLALTASVLTLTSVSVERFVAIVLPLKPRLKPLATSIIITVTWLISIAIATPQLIYRQQLEMYWKDFHEVWCQEQFPEVYIDKDCNTEKTGKKIYYMVQIVVMYFIPIVVMVVAYTLVILKMVFYKTPGQRRKLSTREMSKQKVSSKIIRYFCIIFTLFT